MPPFQAWSAWLPNWTSVRTATYQYVEWRKQGHLVASEYYDLTTDPYELRNRAGNPALAKLLSAKRARIGVLTGHRVPPEWGIARP